MTVQVFSKPSCVQCTATYRALREQGIEYSVLDVSEDPDALQFVKGLGYMTAPVVVTETEHWGGFRPDKIAALAARIGEVDGED